MPFSIRSLSSADRSIRLYPPARWAVLRTPHVDAGALRAFARGHSPSPGLDYWTSVGRQRTGDMQRAFSETTRPSGLRQTVSSVGTATYGRRRVSRPASILRWL